MENKTRKTLKNLLTASIIPLAICLPVKEAKAQKVQQILNPNTVYLIFQPGDLGLGMRYDRRFNKKLYQFGAYSSASRGEYRLGEGCYVKNHLKLGLGGIFYPENPSFKDSNGFFGFGISYHDYGEKADPWKIIDNKGLKPLSIDFSAGVRFEKFNFFINVDPLKREGSIGAGLSFGVFSKDTFKKYEKILAKMNTK
jgi:hypothetical protein